MKPDGQKPEDRRPIDPLMRAADAALRRAAKIAQKRARETLRDGSPAAFNLKQSRLAKP